MAPFHGTVRSIAGTGGCYRVDRPIGVDALRIIGNASASPPTSVLKTVEVTRIVFGAMRRAGTIDVDEPVLASPPLLRAWLLARLQHEAVPAEVLWGPAPGAVTILRSSFGWRAYRPTKRVLYATYLLTLRYLPGPLARNTIRIAARVLA
jgi:hypothetical protein